MKMNHTVGPARNGALLLQWLVCLAIFGSICAARAEYDPVRGVYIRRNIATLNSNSVDLVAYQKGVAAMKKLALQEPVSWQFQANIHGTYNTTSGPITTNWNKCQHQSFFFVSWHRMYVYYLERIVRKQSGNTNFALPYWDYSIDSERALPVYFRVPANASNPLYVRQRNPLVNRGTPLKKTVTTDAQALAALIFIGSYTNVDFGGLPIPQPSQFNNYDFTGQLELQPHNAVHDAVGGWMSDPLTAAADPIFWLHHANIDRVWAEWIGEGGGRSNPTNDTTWMNTQFTFYDENSQQVQMSGKQVLDTATQLGYVYDQPTTPITLASAEKSTAEATPVKVPKLISAARQSGLILGNNLVTATVPLPPEASEQVNAVIASETPVEKISLVLEGVNCDKVPGVIYEVYLNLPEGTKKVDSASAYFVGNLSFFGVKHSSEHSHGDAMGSAGITRTFDITRVVKQLKEKNLWKGEDFKVSLVPGGVEAPAEAKLEIASGSRPRVGKISIVRH